MHKTDGFDTELDQYLAIVRDRAGGGHGGALDVHQFPGIEFLAAHIRQGNLWGSLLTFFVSIREISAIRG